MRRLPKHWRHATRVRHAHTSSRFDKSPKSLLHALFGLIVVADILTMTEVSTEARAKSMHEVPGFLARRGSGGPAADESGIMWRDTVWALEWSGSRELRADSGGARLAIWGFAAVLRHRKTDETVLVVVVHTPAGVEGDYIRDVMTRKVVAHVATTNALAAWIRELVTEHKPDGVLAAADWNLDLFKEWVKQWVRDQFPTLKATWAGHMPKHGTHGKRLIDWTLSNLRVWKIRLLKRNPSSDHAPYVETLLIEPAES